MAHQPSGVHHVQVGAAHIVHHRQIPVLGDGAALEAHALLIADGAVLSHQTDLVGRGDQQTAVQGGEAAGPIAGVVIQFRAAVFILFGPGIDNLPPQAVKAVGVPQHRDQHGRQDHHRQDHEQQCFFLFRFLQDALGRVLLGVAQVEFHLIHSVVHPHTKRVSDTDRPAVP